jgi:hypothetical protein
VRGFSAHALQILVSRGSSTHRFSAVHALSLRCNCNIARLLPNALAYFACFIPPKKGVLAIKYPLLAKRLFTFKKRVFSLLPKRKVWGKFEVTGLQQATLANLLELNE